MKPHRIRYDDPQGHQLWNPQLLLRLLSKHGLAAKTNELPALWDRLCADPESVPVALLDALFHVRAMSDRHAHEQLVDGLGGPLFAADCRALPPRDVALMTWLDHPDLFNRVRGRRAISSARRFREFRGRQVLAIDFPTVATIRRLERLLGAGFERRNRSGHCRIHAYSLDDHYHFDISHGRPRVRDGALEELDEAYLESAVEYRPQQTDRVSFDPKTGLLRVTARDARTIRTYCEHFGAMLFGQIGWFNDTAVLTLTPLVFDPMSALRPTLGLRSVQLVRVQLVRAGTDPLSMTFESGDVLSGLAHHGGVSLEDGEVIAAHLALTLSNGACRVVKLELPNRVQYNHHRDEPVVRTYLEQRGFLDGPMRFQMAS